jgi:hypothetical protein
LGRLSRPERQFRASGIGAGCSLGQIESTSGSTLIAAEQTGRKAFLMELDPLYCDVIVQRFETSTGKKAERVNVDTGGQ